MEYQNINEEYQKILAEETLNKAWEVWKDYFDGVQLDDDLDCFDEDED